MKKALILHALLSCVLSAGLFAGSKPGYQQATIIGVAKYEAPSTYVGDSPSDAPLRPTEYANDVDVRVGCNVYAGRYQSAIDYLPSVFAPNRTVEVRLEKHIMCVNVPGSREVKMGIVAHDHVKDRACPADN